MNPRRLSRTALAAAGTVLCALLTSCSGGDTATTAAPQSPAPQVATASPAPTATPKVKTAPSSQLCAVLDLTAARTVRTDLRSSPRVAPNKGKATDACSYAAADGTALLTLNPGARSYDKERSAAHSLVGDPASAGMSGVRVDEVAGLGQAAFGESGHLVQQKQDIAYVVWRSNSRVWVLTLAEAGGVKGADRLVPLARRIAPRLPR